MKKRFVTFRKAEVDLSRKQIEHTDVRNIQRLASEKAIFKERGYHLSQEYHWRDKSFDDNNSVYYSPHPRVNIHTEEDVREEERRRQLAALEDKADIDSAYRSGVNYNLPCFTQKEIELAFQLEEVDIYGNNENKALATNTSHKAKMNPTPPNSTVKDVQQLSRSGSFTGIKALQSLSQAHANTAVNPSTPPKIALLSNQVPSTTETPIVSTAIVPSSSSQQVIVPKLTLPTSQSKHHRPTSASPQQSMMTPKGAISACPETNEADHQSNADPNYLHSIYTRQELTKLPYERRNSTNAVRSNYLSETSLPDHVVIPVKIVRLRKVKRIEQFHLKHQIKSKLQFASVKTKDKHLQLIEDNKL
jgi:hypothetical protein